MFGLGTTELVVIGVILFFLFGARRLPEIGKGLGGAIREFKKMSRSNREDGQGGHDAGGVKKTAKESPTSIEAKLKEKAVEQVPGAKQALEVKKKADKIREVIDS